MDQEEIDSLLQVIENPVRRRIIRRLSQESCYALQLSKELGLGQPLVAKHLGLMENAGLVTAAEESSPNGPKRKKYTLMKGVSITMDVGPNLYIEKGVTFENRPAKGGPSKVTSQLRRDIEEALEARDDREALSLLSEALSEADIRMNALEGERVELLAVRNWAMQEAARVASNLEEANTRRVLFHILDKHDRQVESISESLNLRELAVRTILEELREYLD